MYQEVPFKVIGSGSVQLNPEVELQVDSMNPGPVTYHQPWTAERARK